MNDLNNIKPIDNLPPMRIPKYDLKMQIIEQSDYDPNKDPDYEHTIIIAAQELSDGMKEIMKGKVTLSSVYGLVSDLVKMAESFFKWSKSGPVKFKVVMNVINKVDSVYHFKTKIANILPLPFPLTMFRKKIADLAIYISIQVIVFAYNEIGW